MSNPIKPLDWLRAAIDDDRLTTTQRAAVAGIARKAPGKSQPNRFAGQETGWDFYLSRNQLAGLMGASIPTAERCFRALHEFGLLEKVTRGGHRGRGERAKSDASVWRLAIPQTGPKSHEGDASNPSLVMTWNEPQPITGDDLEEGSNPSETDLPTHQKGVFQPITGDGPREHRLQESAVLQESSANAQPLTRLVVDENDTTTEQGTGSTQFHNSTTDRTRIPTAMPAANTSEAWV